MDVQEDPESEINGGEFSPVITRPTQKTFFLYLLSADHDSHVGWRERAGWGGGGVGGCVKLVNLLPTGNGKGRLLRVLLCASSISDHNTQKIT